MIFANLLFLYLFLPANLLFYHISKNPGYRNAVLILFSLFFYAWGEPVWITLLIFSALIDYLNGLFTERFRGTPLAKWGVVSSVAINLALLVSFKYGAFLVTNINGLFHLSLPVPGFSLPIGISFYTFQTISYVVDVYRGEVHAQKSFSKFLLFVSLYHQLVAGPIVRYSNIASEIDSRRVTAEDFSAGLTRLIMGLSKKVIIANAAGSFASQYLDGDLSALSVGGAWFGVMMFTIQIYFDFSGYSDMAIGLGRMFGFHYLENFRYPYVAKSATDFWRRWHISLSAFFRDYLYIPLGGNRRHQYRNLFIVWFCTGLWHGASWNFIIWGVYYGIFIAMERLFLGKWLKKIPAVFSHLYLLLIVNVGWAIFYFTDFSRLGMVLKTMFGLAGKPFLDVSLPIQLANNLFWILLCIIACLPIVPTVKRMFSLPSRQGIALLGNILQIAVNIGLLILCTSLLVGESYNPFLYYRF